MKPPRPIVEFIGVAASGKTTLLESVREELERQGIVAQEQYDAVLSPFKLDFVKHPRLKSALVDVVAFPAFLSSLLHARRRELLRQALRMIRRDASSLSIKINLLRNVVKRMGVSTLLRAGRSRDGCVLCDEGSVHIAHNLFVRAGMPPENEEIVTFAVLVPKPDLLVCVTAPTEDSVACILERGHLRVPPSAEAARAFVEHGQEVFSVLCATGEIKESVLIVANEFSTEGHRAQKFRDSVDGIVEFIKDRIQQTA